METLLYDIVGRSFDAAVWARFGSTLAIILVCVAALVAVCIALWHAKESYDDRIFTVTRESIGEQSEKIAVLLRQMKATKREVTNALLLLEEIAVRLHEQVNAALTCRVKKSLGDVSIVLSSFGDAFNPFSELEWNGNSEDVYRDLIFHAHKQELSYSRWNGRNIVTVRVHSAGSRAMFYTFGAMALGILCGFGMKWLPDGAAAFLANGVLSTVQTLFMNALMLLIAPVVFFSLTTSLSGLSSGNNMGRIGGKVLSTYLFTTVAAILIAFGVSYLFFGGNVPPLPEMIAPVPDYLQKTVNVSVSSLLISIIPRNLVSPVANGALMQVLFVAVFVGIALGSLGEKTAGLRSLFNEANELFLKMMGMVIVFMPLMAFASFALLVYSTSASVLLMLLSYIGAVVLACAAMFIMYALLVAIVGRKNPLPYLKKATVFFLTPFALSSSSACIPLTMDFCKKKLGVSEKVASFSIPLGATVNMDGTCITMVIASVMFARMCGIPIDGAMIVKIALMTFVLSVGAPGVPGAGLVCVATILPAIGVPVHAIGFIVGIYQITSRFQTGSNINGDIAAALVVSASEDELNETAYKA